MRRDINEWAESARSRPTFMAGALDFPTIAREMMDVGLASYHSSGIVVAGGLAELAIRADHATFVGIARILLSKSPPFWLSLVVVNGRVLREYIPRPDLEALLWIDPDLDHFLLSIHAATERVGQDAYAKRLGDAAEFFIYAALKLAGKTPLHVAKISDAYGYDIEYQSTRTERVEVKAASSNTQGGFHLSRNEYDKSLIYGREWRLVQLTFSNRAFVDSTLNSSHVESIRELKFGALDAFIPKDTDNFRWSESSQINAPDAYWQPVILKMDPEFVTPGLRKMP